MSLNCELSALLTLLKVQIKYPTKLRVALDVVLLINSQTVFK